MDSYVGKRLDGRYEIREIIGVGGMAVVYKAYDNIDDRIVAVKILKEEFLANEEFRRRFKNESKAIAVLSHPNIVKVYDVSFGDKLQYIVMEYIEGITLKEYIEQQKVINWKEAIHFTTQILRALQHAHDKGIVHRDVKPQNIMLLQNGNIKVTDFGIARFSRSETRTMTESAIGSVHYISPEQARGEITDDKADIYSVGVVLYEMVTGQLPFQSDSAVSVAIMQLQAEAKPPREINESIPLGLEQIILRAMQKSTKDRYQSAAEMLLDLDEFKRNPSIKFDYTYFVDNEPTKFINKPGTVPAVADFAGSGVIPDAADFEEEEEERKSTLPVLIGVLSALVVVIILVVTFLYFFTDVFKKDTVAVPSLLGMNYAKDIQGNSKYSNFKIEPNYVTSSNSKYNAGEVSSQNPTAGKKVSKGTKIKVDVIKSGTTVEIPEINNLDVGTARQMLSAAGFNNVTYTPQYKPDMDANKIISSDPKQKTKVDVTTAIKVYYSTKTNPDDVKVPSVIGDSLEDAKAYLTNSHLSPGSTSSEDNVAPPGTVISQSIGGLNADGSEKVVYAPRNTNVNLVLSTGKAPSKSVNLSIKLPNMGSGSFKVYLNNNPYPDATKTDILLNGDGNYPFSVTSSGTGTINVRINDTDYCQIAVDFNAGSQGTTTYLSGVLPDVSSGKNKTLADATAVLKAAGFNNVTSTTQISLLYSGYVIGQSTQGDPKKLIPVSTQITLTVGS